MSMPKIKEFMIFIDNDDKKGVIIKSPYSDLTWHKCYYGSGGQVFAESPNDEIFEKINKLYESPEKELQCYSALKFMNDGVINKLKFKCVYDKEEEMKKEKEQKRIKTVEQKLKDLGIETKYTDGTYKPFILVINDLIDKWENN